jgi:hypothetical protein
MAYSTGTATNRADLMTKMIAFLTTDSSLVAANQNWDVLSTAGAGTDFLLRGPGLAELDQIHVRLYSGSIPDSDIFGWSIQGFTSYNASLAHDLQPGISSIAGMALWDSPMPYWFVANGRRFVVVVKVSTVYVSLYAGFILPYATPSEFPYPLYVAGSHESATTDRWSASTHDVGGFFDPSDGNAYFRHNDGAWLTFANYSNGSGNSRQSADANLSWPYETDLQLRENNDGTRTLLPVILYSSYSGGNVYGELDGVFFLPGFGIAAEDTITIGSDTYFVFQSVYRTDRRAYAALKLE